MDTVDIVYFIIMCIAVVAALFILIYTIIGEVKRAKEKMTFLNNIKVGDVFVYDPNSPNGDPFIEREKIYVTIIDMKKNQNGEMYVKYIHSKTPDTKGLTEFTDRLTSFIRFREKVNV
ncbi:MAG: hypothetical protein J6J23_04275 [Clostridia bacterium]|nr:hypothetical protein [Clostridia bacterium]